MSLEQTVIEHDKRLTRLEEAFVSLTEIAQNQNKALRQINDKLVSIEANTQETMKLTRALLDLVNRQGDRLDGRLARVEQRLESMDSRLEKVEQALIPQPPAPRPLY